MARYTPDAFCLPGGVKIIFSGDESDPESETEEEARERGDFAKLLFAAKNNRIDMFKGTNLLVLKTVPRK